MFEAPIEMRKVSLYMVDSDAQQAALTLAGLSVLHPFETPQAEREMREYPAASYHEVYHELHSRYAKVAGYLEQPLGPEIEATGIVTQDELRELDEQVRRLWASFSEMEERLRRQHEKLGAIRQLSNSLQKFSSLDLDLGRLRRRGRFLRIFVGTVPSGNFDQLRRALSLSGFLARSFFSSEGLEHVVVFGSSRQQDDVQDVLTSADFRGLNIPDEFDGSSNDLIHLARELAASDTEAPALYAICGDEDFLLDGNHRFRDTAAEVALDVGVGADVAGPLVRAGDDPHAIGEKVGHVHDAPSVEERVVAIRIFELVVGGAADDACLQPRNGRGIENRAGRARREDVAVDLVDPRIPGLDRADLQSLGPGGSHFIGERGIDVAGVDTSHAALEQHDDLRILVADHRVAVMGQVEVAKPVRRHDVDGAH